MQRYRIRWTKLGRVRFVSARDLQSVWERALRRADLPIAYSEGFSPHAKVSFPDALSVGFVSTGEYAELTFAAPISPERDLAALSAALPEGMDITTYLAVPDGAPKLARMLRVTLWEQVWPAVDADELTDLLSRRGEELLAADHAEVIRRRPNGDKTIDVRPAVLALAARTRPDPGGARTVLRAVLRNDGPTVRPPDLLMALAEDAAVRGDASPRRPVEIAPPVTTCRVAQGEFDGDRLREALSGELVALEPGVDAEAA
jgi:radical SAM-linked protein